LQEEGKSNCQRGGPVAHLAQGGMFAKPHYPVLLGVRSPGRVKGGWSGTGCYNDRGGKKSFGVTEKEDRTPRGKGWGKGNLPCMTTYGKKKRGFRGLLDPARKNKKRRRGRKEEKKKTTTADAFREQGWVEKGGFLAGLPPEGND